MALALLEATVRSHRGRPRAAWRTENATGAAAATRPAAFKLGDTVAFSDTHLRERVGTAVRMNTKTYSLLRDGEQWRVSPALLRKIINL